MSDAILFIDETRQDVNSLRRKGYLACHVCPPAALEHSDCLRIALQAGGQVDKVADIRERFG